MTQAAARKLARQLYGKMARIAYSKASRLWMLKLVHYSGDRHYYLPELCGSTLERLAEKMRDDPCKPKPGA